ncbi:hypothetical protein ACFWP5_38285 [Streptomyces sp. NPDC058469]|uniref:hypothetical protein n=1 Tax=Streptomyces sp. NPDC058469 TaxID=3346514 RepID=UPI00365B91B8
MHHSIQAGTQPVLQPVRELVRARFPRMDDEEIASHPDLGPADHGCSACCAAALAICTSPPTGASPGLC